MILAVVNQKGGVGKTTTAVNLAAYLEKAKKKVLLIDLDPQGNATSGFGISKDLNQKTSYDCLINGTKIEDVICETGRKNLHISPANIHLAGAEIELVPVDEREYQLKKVVNTVKDDYDFILIDCPPSLGLLTINALVASDGVIIPVQSEYYALEGLSQLIETIRMVQKGYNKSLEVFGIIITMYDKRTSLSVQVAEDIKAYFKKKVFKTIIPRSVRLSEAPSFGKSVEEYAPKSKGAEAYTKLAKEIVKRAKGIED